MWYLNGSLKTTSIYWFNSNSSEKKNIYPIIVLVIHRLLYVKKTQPTKDAHIILDHFGREKKIFVNMFIEALARQTVRDHEKGLSRVEVCLIDAKRIKLKKRKNGNSLIKPILLESMFVFMTSLLHTQFE